MNEEMSLSNIIF